MKILFISFFIAFICCASSDDEKCKKYAVDIDNGSPPPAAGTAERLWYDRTGSVTKESLTNSFEAEFFIARASHRPNSSDVYCTGITFGDGCGPIKYKRTMEEKGGDLFMNIQVLTYNIKTEEAVRITHKAKLVSKTDLIFEVVGDNINIENFTSDGQTDRNETDKQNKAKQQTIQAVTATKFAINRLIYDEDNKLAAVVTFSCNGDLAYVAYTKEVVEKNEEGKYAKLIEEQLEFWDLKKNDAVRNNPAITDEDDKTNTFNHENVKPISTAFPDKFTYKPQQSK